jgi:hypothetical protein
MRNVVIYGRSLMASSLSAGLRGCPGMVVQQFDAFDEERAESGLEPDAIIVDMSAAQTDLISVLLRRYPSRLLIGADPKSDELLVLSSRPIHAMSADALLQIIENNLSLNKET